MGGTTLLWYQCSYQLSRWPVHSELYGSRGIDSTATVFDVHELDERLLSAVHVSVGMELGCPTLNHATYEAARIQQPVPAFAVTADQALGWSCCRSVSGSKPMKSSAAFTVSAPGCEPTPGNASAKAVRLVGSRCVFHLQKFADYIPSTKPVLVISSRRGITQKGHFLFF
jgi:hypothetical protein